ncbi:hypothetical protein ACRALDRAFT_2040127 [Sodiomyces alcalophilus JCM 7366]|uniref:uncharacterized protein n=1 Tax=Sodiomyces alcalophilus JCM 7366 TaxID=591952 RepID=UPI0039B4B036
MTSSRTSPLPPTTPAPTSTSISTTTSPAAPAVPMAAPGYAHLPRHMRSNAPQHHYTLLNSAVQPLDHDGNQDPATASPTTVLIRQLPKGTTVEQVGLMVLWSDEIVDMEILPDSPGGQHTSAKILFRSAAGAMEVKNKLDGKKNMVVDIVESGGASRNYANEAQSGGTSSAESSSAGSSAPTSRHGSHFGNNRAFSGMGNLSPPMSNAFGPNNNELPSPENSARYQNLFSPQSPIGNHLNTLPRVSGKSLIKRDSVDDDETGELLKDPVAYAENGASTTQRRATAPQLPIAQLSNLSLDTNFGPGPSSMPPPSGHLHHHHHHHHDIRPGHRSAMSPTATNGGGALHGAQRFVAGHPPVAVRLLYPPPNPADQNPPCNTLYVGNLPIGTSEEELKAAFSRQRGYKRLCFRTKQNGPMCFVEFEDVACASKALKTLHGLVLHNSGSKGGIRLSYSKNPLGVRSGQNTGQGAGGHCMAGMMVGSSGGYATTTSGPPPGLSAPPGLGGHGWYGGGVPPSAQSGIPAGFPAAGGGLPISPWNAQTGAVPLDELNPAMNGQHAVAFMSPNRMGR